MRSTSVWTQTIWPGCTFAPTVTARSASRSRVAWSMGGNPTLGTIRAVMATLVEQWDAIIAAQPRDWSFLDLELVLRDSSTSEEIALVLSPLNPWHQRDWRTGIFRFRTARAFGYGSATELCRKRLQTLASLSVVGTLRAPRGLSHVRPGATQGARWGHRRWGGERRRPAGGRRPEQRRRPSRDPRPGDRRPNAVLGAHAVEHGRARFRRGAGRRRPHHLGQRPAGRRSRRRLPEHAARGLRDARPRGRRPSRAPRSASSRAARRRSARP